MLGITEGTTEVNALIVDDGSVLGLIFGSIYGANEAAVLGFDDRSV